MFLLLFTPVYFPSLRWTPDCPRQSCFSCTLRTFIKVVILHLHIYKFTFIYVILHCVDLSDYIISPVRAVTMSVFTCDL